MVRRSIAALGAWAAAHRPVRLAAALDGWIDAEHGRFMPWLAVAMIAGAASYFGLRTEPAAWTGGAAVLVAALGTAATWRFRVPRAVAMAALVGAAGFLSAQAQTRRALPIDALPVKAAILTGTVRAVDALPEGRRVLLAGVRTDPAQPALARLVRVRLRRGDLVDLAAGDRIQLRSLIRPPAPPAYPGGWDLQRDAFFSGLGASGFALNPAVVLEHVEPAGAAAWLQGLRDGIARRVIAGLPGPEGAVAATVLTGTGTAIPAADRAAFRDSGLAHLLAVAGLHIGIVMGLVMGGTRLMLAASERAALHWPTKAIAGGVALAVGGGYLLLTGAHVPIIRSFAMACLVTLGLMLGRRSLSLRGLALAAAAIVLIAPNEVAGVSFQMSFAAVLALIAGYEAMRPVLARLHGNGVGRRTLHHLALLALTSLLAGTASAPFAAYHFGHFQLYFIVANLAAVPITAFLVMPAGLAALALMPMGLEQLALAPMGWGIEAILWIARTVSGWPAATLAVPAMPGWGLLVVGGGLAWLGLWRSRVRLAGAAVMAAGLLSCLAARPPDVLVSSDARLIAFRDGGYWLQSRSGASGFVRDAWRDHLAAGPLQVLQEESPAGCTASACRVGPVGLLVLRDAARVGDCTGIRLLVSAEPARGECPSGVPYIDRFSVWRDGAYAAWLTPEGARVLSDRTYRGERPWVPPPPQPHHSVPNLPMAAAEEMPVALTD